MFFSRTIRFVRSRAIASWPPTWSMSLSSCSPALCAARSCALANIQSIWGALPRFIVTPRQGYSTFPTFGCTCGLADCETKSHACLCAAYALKQSASAFNPGVQSAKTILRAAIRLSGDRNQRPRIGCINKRCPFFVSLCLSSGHYSKYKCNRKILRLTP